MRLGHEYNWSLSYEDGEYARDRTIPVGSKGKIVTPYKVESDIKNIRMTINNQYTLTTAIEE